MKNLKKFSYSPVGFDEHIKVNEELLRDYLLKNADYVRLTFQKPSLSIKNLLKGDGKLLKVLENLRVDFVDQELNNLRFDDIEQGNHLYDHYFFNLSPNMKKILNQETLLWNSDTSEMFFSLEDPSFFSNGRLIGSVISHEPIFVLYLTDEEAIDLKEKGATFD